MNAPPLPKTQMGITLRTALLSWMVTIGTLLIFVLAIIPEQKRTFLENLDSKANGVAVSLRDVAAGAAVNEDYSSVVDYCKEIIRGDEALDYLVITKNNGFSLLHDRSGWRSEENLPAFWRPANRKPHSGIKTVPLFDRRVFHFAQPFDYSGIQWGWIHVGLSLEKYDRSVKKVQWRTLILAAFCTLLSLAASALYARRLVRPILNLRAIVQEVAAGDLLARASEESADEIGSLAASFNSMTEGLLRRDKILQTVRYAAQQFLSTNVWRAVLDEVLASIGRAAGVSRVQILQHASNPDGSLIIIPRHEWFAAEFTPPLHPREPISLSLAACSAGFRQALETNPREEVFAARAREETGGAKTWFEKQQVQSLLLSPIMVEGARWGSLAIAESQSDRTWTDAERDSLRAIAGMVGAAMTRQGAQDALLEAKETLEQRVDERTRELRAQVAAEAKARAELADAQQRLVETSRQAGMAEVATGVLHNVGNVLNSVNVSATLVQSRIQRSKVSSLLKAAELLKPKLQSIGAFLESDPQGKKIPEFLVKVAEHLEGERQDLVKELLSLIQNIEHIKEIVAMQQSYAKVSGTKDVLPVTPMIEDALRLSADSLQSHGIALERDYHEVPAVCVDKHKTLQILINLIRNAQYAVKVCPRPDKKLAIRVDSSSSDRVRIKVQDNGIGIAPGNLIKIFQHGFTTKKDGHGFGLHSGAIAAREMGGSLSVQSDGVGHGASFILELPTSPFNGANLWKQAIQPHPITAS